MARRSRFDQYCAWGTRSSRRLDCAYKRAKEGIKLTPRHDTRAGTRANQSSYFFVCKDVTNVMKVPASFHVLLINFSWVGLIVQIINPTMLPPRYCRLSFFLLIIEFGLRNTNPGVRNVTAFTMYSSGSQVLRCDTPPMLVFRADVRGTDRRSVKG